jgi:hypothetical protein
VLSSISDDGFASLLSEKNEIREDLKIPENLLTPMREAFNSTSADSKTIYISVTKVCACLPLFTFFVHFIVIAIIYTGDGFGGDCRLQRKSLSPFTKRPPAWWFKFNFFFFGLLIYL